MRWDLVPASLPFVPPRRVSREAELDTWAKEQRALARSLGISIEAWVAELASAGERTAGLTAAVIGAAVSRGASLTILNQLHGDELARRAAELIDPTPPSVQNPTLAEAIRRADELASTGLGRARLRREPPRPERTEAEPAPSADQATADAPGDVPRDEEP